MIKAEFLQGYALLTIQPWGKLYRGNGPEATIQMELYWRHVSQANPIVWKVVCEAHATGDRWPNLTDLKNALSANGGYRQVNQAAIGYDGQDEFDDAPEVLSACFAYQREHECTLKEAYCTIIPVWIAQNPEHEDLGHAMALLGKAQHNFGMPVNRGGNVKAAL